MKILDVLIKEVFDFGNDTRPSGSEEVGGFKFLAPKISTSELDSMELFVLRTIQRGAFDIETAADSQVDAYMELQAMGFIDSDGNITDSGNFASQPADLSTPLSNNNVGVDSDDYSEPADMDELEDDDDIDFNIAGYRRVGESVEGAPKTKQEIARGIANIKAHMKEFGMSDAERKRLQEMLSQEEEKLAKLRNVKESWGDDSDDWTDEEIDDERRRWPDDDEEHDPEVFANPGSALRVSGRNNPRNLPCPTCHEPNRITREDRARHYQCDDCADRAEGKWNGRGEY
jgi:DNA-binding ferritin-like protein (Dps family)